MRCFRKRLIWSRPIRSNRGGRAAWHTACPLLPLQDLEKLFRLKALGVLLRKKKIPSELIRMLDSRRLSGFNVFASERIQPREKKSLENLAAYLIRSSFSQRRMEYLP